MDQLNKLFPRPPQHSRLAGLSPGLKTYPVAASLRVITLKMSFKSRRLEACPGHNLQLINKSWHEGRKRFVSPPAESLTRCRDKREVE